MKDSSSTLGEPPAGAKARATYEALLAAAERLLDAEGLPGLVSTAVAAEAGVATGTFYTYFADKDALLGALFARRLDGISQAVEAVLSAERLAADGLERTMRAAVDAVLAGYRAHSTVIRAALGRIPDSALLRAVYWERHERATREVASFLGAAAAAGHVRDAPADTLALALLVIVQGLNHPVLLAGGDRASQAVAGHLVRALAAMLAPDETAAT